MSFYSKHWFEGEDKDDPNIYTGVKMGKKNDIDKALTSQKPRQPVIPPDAWLSIGTTLGNLACSGRASGGIAKGMYLYVVGDSEAGKTWIALSILGEASINKNFDKYQLIYDPTENGAKMELATYFGEKMASRIHPPRGTRAKPEYSSTIQEFYYNVDDMLERGPGIYICDSMDGLLAEEDEEQFQKEKDAYNKGKEAKGSYGMAKAKANSQNIKRVVSKLAKTGSILVIISQTRDSIAKGPFKVKTRSGGRALKFYAHVELWTSVVGTITKPHRDKDRPIGNTIQIQVQKNRVNGWHGKVEIPFLTGFGIDDVGSCVDYLISEGHWKKTQGIVDAKEFEFKGPVEKLVQEVQDEGSERELQLLVQKVWREITEALKPNRKSRYV